MINLTPHNHIYFIMVNDQQGVLTFLKPIPQTWAQSFLKIILPKEKEKFNCLDMPLAIILLSGHFLPSLL